MAQRAPVKVDARHIIKVSELRAHTSEWIKASEEEPVLVLRHGKPAAYLIGPDLLEKILEEFIDRVELKAELEHRKRISKGAVPLGDLMRRFT